MVLGSGRVNIPFPMFSSLEAYWLSFLLDTVGGGMLEYLKKGCWGCYGTSKGGYRHEELGSQAQTLSCWPLLPPLAQGTFCPKF